MVAELAVQETIKETIVKQIIQMFNRESPSGYIGNTPVACCIMSNEDNLKSLYKELLQEFDNTPDTGEKYAVRTVIARLLKAITQYLSVRNVDCPINDDKFLKEAKEWYMSRPILCS